MKHRISTVIIWAVLCTHTFAESDKPNILFILVDDLGWRDLACYGHEIHQTPNIDRLASRGMRFTDAYAACPICGPSRAAIMTGKFPSRTGYVDNFIDRKKRIRQFMELEEFTLAEAFKAGGYQTGFVGKWHLTADSESRLPTDQGFDVNVAGSSWGHPLKGFFSPYHMPGLENGPKGEYLTDRLTSEAIRAMDDFSRKERPWLLYMSYYTVHAPFHAKAEKTRKYAEKARQANVKLNAKYAAMVESLDENVGRMLKWLDEKGLRKNTIVVFTSDNGGFHMATHNRPLRGYKGELYDGGIREPLIINVPGVTKPGSVCNKPVHGTDFYPTLLELAGLAPRPEQHCDGVSLVPALKGSAGFDRGPMIWHYPVSLPRHHSEPGSAIRIGDWKFMQYYNDGRRELYNLKDDIGEKNNLLESMPEKAATMKAKLEAALKEHGAKIPARASAPQPGKTKIKGLLAHFDFRDGNLLNNEVEAGARLVQQGPVKVELMDGTARFQPVPTPAQGRQNWLEAALPRLKTFTVSFWFRTDTVDQGGRNQGVISSGGLTERTSWQQVGRRRPCSLHRRLGQD